MPFDDFEDEFENAPSPGDGRTRAEITPEAFAALPAPQVPCGFFTLTLTDGSRRRFRIRLERGRFFTGRRTLAIYAKFNPDDEVEREWESLGIVGHTGFDLFGRWKWGWEARWAAGLWVLLNGQEFAGYSVEIERRCWLCMKELGDDEASQRTGLTPICRAKVLPF